MVVLFFSSTSRCVFILLWKSVWFVWSKIDLFSFEHLHSTSVGDFRYGNQQTRHWFKQLYCEKHLFIVKKLVKILSIDLFVSACHLKCRSQCYGNEKLYQHQQSTFDNRPLHFAAQLSLCDRMGSVAICCNHSCRRQSSLLCKTIICTA